MDLPQASVVPGPAVDTGFPNAEQRRYLIELLRAAKCPEPRCTDGSIISTGPDPQNDACQWCYQRHVTIEALQEGHSQYSPEPKPTIDAFRWMGDLAAFEKWYGERCPVDFGGQISVPTKKDGPTWMRVWCGNWIIRRPDGEHYCMADANFRYMVEEWGDGLIPGECPAQSVPQEPKA